MIDQKYAFMYCQKLVIFSEDWQSVLLAKRYGEADYDGVYSFIGGKLEVSDGGLLPGLNREKCEEIGAEARIEVHMAAARNIYFVVGSNGKPMILPHILGHHLGGEIHLNADEYSEYQWVPIAELQAFEPKIKNIPDLVAWASQLRATLGPDDFEIL